MKYYNTLLFLFLNFVLCSQTYEIPKAKKIADTLVLHGDTLIDQYNWMKDKNNPNLINYLYAENAYANNTMKKTTLLQNELYEEIKKNIRENDSSIPVKKDDYYYYSKTEKGKEYSILCRKHKSLANEEEIYLDINELAEKYAYFSLLGVSVSPNHKMIGYVIDTEGDESGTLFIKNMANDSLLTNTINRVTSFMWAEDNKTILYIPRDSVTKKSTQIFAHQLGETKKDVLLYTETRPKFGVSFGKSTSKEYIFIYSGSFLTAEISYVSAKKPLQKLTLIDNTKDVYFAVDHFFGDEFIIITNENAPNNKVLKASIRNLVKKNWETIIPASDSNTINGYHVFKDYIVVSKLENGLNKIEIQNKNTNEKYYLTTAEELGDIGVILFFKYQEQKLWYATTSYISPTILYEYNLVTKKDSLLRDYTLPGYKKEDYTAKRIWSTSKDGTKVPIDIAYKKSTVLNKNTPLYLTAYASYGNNSFPDFSSLTILLMDRGFVFAQAHPRGESLFGKKWHDEGKMLNKINTTTDFISCTEFLHQNGISSPQKTAITGRSAGGMLMGSVVTMRPDLYQAVVLGVPYIDVINGQLDTTMPGTTAHFEEIGNPRIKTHYEALLKWDPYQNIKPTNYPDMLVLSGYNDPRVYYWLPTKWTAKMREYKTDSNLFLLKTDMESGHFGGAGRYKALKEYAFEYAFIFNSLGIKEDYKNITGTVYDKNGDPIPFVNIIINGTQKGTASNFNGEFGLTVRSDEPQELVFSSVSFKKKLINLNNLTQDTLKIVLESEDILLNKVTVSANAKDPAYGIIKNAIDKRKFHLKQMESFEAVIYLKSSIRLNELPEKRPFFIKAEDMPDSTDLGLLYLSESSSKVFYEYPNNIKEEMYASIVAGYNQGYSSNRTTDVLFNFYENNIELPNYSEKLYLSPIASTALVYYRYTYAGTLFEGKKQVHKIEVRPRIKGDPLFHGYIYINDSSWSIHSLNLMLTKDAQIKFFDTLNFKQEYAPINDIWTPISLTMTSNIKIFGIGAKFNTVGIFNDYKLNKKFPKGFFGNAIFKIDENANKKDSIYWGKNRPISLTEEEQNSYYKQDSIAKAEESPAYKDSVRKEYNKIKALNLLLSGFNFQLKSDSAWIGVNSLVGMVGFNTVEGWLLSPSIDYRKKLKDYKSFSLTATGRYGFEIEDWGAKLEGSFYTNDITKERISFSAGKYIDELNYSSFNMWYSLLDKRNYKKINQKTFANVSYSRELVNGLYAGVYAEIESRKYLTNHSSISWKKTSRAYTLNYPVEASVAPFNHDQLTLRVAFRYVINQKYELYPKQKINLSSKSPTLRGSYKKAIGLSNKQTGYDMVKLGISQQIKLGQIGNISYFAEAGKYFNANNIQFWDYKHFLGNQTLFVLPTPNMFETLPYFTYSTNKEYAEIHVTHKFNGFIMNKIPLIRKLRWEALAGINSAFTPSKNYHELYFGVENIFKFLRIDFAGGISNNTKFRPALRIGLDLSL